MTDQDLHERLSKLGTHLESQRLDQRGDLFRVPERVRPGWSRARALLVAAVALVAVGGVIVGSKTLGGEETVVASDGSTGSASEGVTAQRAALADGTVTFEEYEGAVLRYRDCMEAQGASFSNFRFEQSTELYEWFVDTDGDAGCYATELGQVDEAWQNQVWVTQADQRAARRDRLLACLADEGIEHDPDAKLNVLIITGHENGFDSLSCP